MADKIPLKAGPTGAEQFVSGDTIPASIIGASVITPAQITSDQDNYSPTGFAGSTIVRLSADSGIRAITGFSATSISDGNDKTIINVGSYPIYFPADHPDSSSSNRINFDRDFFLFPKQSVKIIYDSTLSKWNILGDDYSLKRVFFLEYLASSITTGDHAFFSFGALNSGAFASIASPASGLPYAHSFYTASLSTGGAYILPTKVSPYTPGLYGNGHFTAGFWFYIPTLSDGTNTFTTEFQITNAPASSSLTPNNTMGVRYTHGTNSGKFLLFSKDNAGSESTADTGITVSANTLYYIKIEADKAKTEVRAYIDGVYAARVTGNLPNNALGIGARAIILKSVGTTSRILNIISFDFRMIFP